MFQICEEAFREDDTEKASRVLREHVALKKAFVDYTKEVAASDLSADMAIVYATGARILRRISAHLSNIASSVVQPYDKIRHDDEES